MMTGTMEANGKSVETQADVIEREEYLRLAADFDNYKKRVKREREREASAEKVALVSDLLPVADNLERALATGGGAEIQGGVKLTLELLHAALKRHGFEPREDLGQPFDGRYHDAIAVGKDVKYPPMTVIEVWQRGWMRGEALFRPAKVLVNDAASEPVGEAEG